MRGPAKSIALAAIAGFGHLIYPLYLARKTKEQPTPVAPKPTSMPPISVVIPAYLEAEVIRAKVDDVMANGYPGELEVVVVADDPATAGAARETAATVLEAPERSGKATALNRGVAAAAHDVVVISDANTTLSDGALVQLVRWLDDPSIAAVAGEKSVSGGRGESAYWKFESWLKQREFMTGTTIGLVGELAAIRREHFRPLPEDVTNDDLWIALDLAARGVRIAYEPGAVATEEEVPLEDEWERRTRIVAGALDVLLRRRSELILGATPVTNQVWGHRLIRMTAGPLAHAALLRRSVRSAHRSKLARAFLAAHVAAGAALYRQRHGEELTAPEKAAAQLLWLQLVAFGGMWRFARRESTVLWPKRPRDIVV
jgi:cellulose synthase/poly-beta-1,6-N-acetylglucosamine synthase-like glycosyltransferase